MVVAIWVFFGILLLVTIAVGVLYIREAVASSKATFTEPRQKYVLGNLEKFQVINKGPTLNNDEVYLIEYEEFGY